MADTLKLLGKLAPDDAGRDAVHIAVIPVLAAHALQPGETVGWSDATKTTVGLGSEESSLGVVDPFLTKTVKKGQRFWLFLFPQTISSLRHVWQHPEFPDEFPPAGTVADEERAASEQWLRQFCASSDCPDYETVMQLIRGKLPTDYPEYYSSGGYIDHEYMHFNGRDAHGAIPPLFWHHVEKVLGRRVDLRPTTFSCSC